MQHINKLLGFGKGVKCLIVGGGHSLNGFRWDCLPSDLYIICLNDHYSQMADMILYYDRIMKKYFDKHCIADRTKLVGFKNNTIDHTVDRCDYFYTYKEIDFGDSGYHALQIADKIFDFTEIFLIGYDYKTRDKSYHHNESESDEVKMRKFTGHSIGKVLPKYDKMYWTNQIFNCYKDSNLKKFKHKLPYKETI